MTILTALCCSGAMAAGKPLKVYILAGQSNMQGTAKRSTFDYIGDGPATALVATRRLWAAEPMGKSGPAGKKPNILLCLSDDQLWPHASAYGVSVIQTPNFDRAAKQGVLFNQAYCGRHNWPVLPEAE